MSEDVFREVRMTDDAIRVEHVGPDYDWSSDVTIKATAKGTVIEVGDVRLHITGRSCIGKLTYGRGPKEVTVWEGDYRGEPTPLHVIAERMGHGPNSSPPAHKRKG